MYTVSYTTSLVVHLIDISPIVCFLRLLNRRARVKLSPEHLDLDVLPGKGELFAVANALGGGCFAAVTRGPGGQYSTCVEL